MDRFVAVPDPGLPVEVASGFNLQIIPAHFLHLAALLESQTRSKFFGNGISELVDDVHQEVSTTLMAAVELTDGSARTEMIHKALDRTIIRQALQVRKASMSGDTISKLFINLSAQEIQGRNILSFAEQQCEKLEIPPNRIVFEILERDAIGDTSNMRKFLNDLGKKGFAFALDDFGSGYNSFHYLRELRFKYVKIDGAFVRNIINSKIDRALVHNLARLCRDIGIRTVAEFVEDDDILLMLREMGIDYAQGYHIGMPRPYI